MSFYSASKPPMMTTGSERALLDGVPLRQYDFELLLAPFGHRACGRQVHFSGPVLAQMITG